MFSLDQFRWDEMNDVNTPLSFMCLWAVLYGKIGDDESNCIEENSN